MTTRTTRAKKSMSSTITSAIDGAPPSVIAAGTNQSLNSISLDSVSAAEGSLANDEISAADASSDNDAIQSILDQYSPSIGGEESTLGAESVQLDVSTNGDSGSADSGGGNDLSRIRGAASARSRVSGSDVLVEDDFEAGHDFNLLQGLIRDVDDAVRDEVMSVVHGLRSQVTRMRNSQDHMRTRVEVMTHAYRIKCGRGKNRFARDMKHVDGFNTTKIRKCVDAMVVPRSMILKPGWDVYSDSVKSFCQIFLQKAAITVSGEYASMKSYWMLFVAPTINYSLGSRRNNLVQAIRRKWVGGYCMKYYVRRV